MSRYENAYTPEEKMGIDGWCPHLLGDDKPMGGLSYRDWEIYVEVLNAELRELWPKAYPNETFSKFEIPTEAELRYGMTDPLPEHEQSDVGGIRITAKLNTFSGTKVPLLGDHTHEQQEELDQFVVQGRKWESGPKAVTEIRPNQRGIIAGTGNIGQITSTKTGIYFNYQVMLGGSWSSSHLHSNVYEILLPDTAEEGVGLRIVRRNAGAGV